MPGEMACQREAGPGGDRSGAGRPHGAQPGAVKTFRRRLAWPDHGACTLSLLSRQSFPIAPVPGPWEKSF